MSTHANQEVRCEAQDPQPEGIFLDKMDLITSKWGATWADIYSILFPGAPVPSPYYEYPALETDTSRSPRSQNFEDFETYSRIELPRLVEANLQVMVDAQTAPLEESLRAMLVDIVRRCQSTIAQNYGRINAVDRSGIHDSDPLLGNTTSRGTLDLSANTLDDTDIFQHDSPSFFEEPPLLPANEADAIANTFPSVPHNDASDSDAIATLFPSLPHNNAFYPDSIAPLFPSSSHNDASDSGYGSQPACEFIFGQQHILD
ncbi:MAG: hypothetical protein Q9169_007215, partial [Polycauliona sp. 2 TL-2023]